MADPRPRVAYSKPIRLDQLAAEVGAPLAASSREVVVAPDSSSVTAEALRSAVDAHQPQPQVPSSAVRLHHFATGDDGEQVTSLALSPSVAAVVLTVPVPDIRTGDLLMVLSEAQVSNKNGYNALFMGHLLVATSPTATVGTEISEANGTNVTPAMHHYAMAKVGTFHATANLGDRHVNLVCRGAASQAKAGDQLVVDQDYGRLSVVRFRSA